MSHPLQQTNDIKQTRWQAVLSGFMKNKVQFAELTGILHPRRDMVAS